MDHHALVWLVTRPARTSNGRILHWIADLMEYHFDIVHRAGKLHVDADAVSRLLHYQELAKEFSVNERPVHEEEGQACRPLEKGDIQDMYRRAEVQKEYYEFILGINNTYQQMQKYPEFFRMITNKDYLMSALKKYQYEEDPENEVAIKLSKELEEIMKNKEVRNNEFAIDNIEEERKEEFDIQIRQLMCQPCENEYADVSDCESDSEEEGGYGSAMESEGKEYPSMPSYRFIYIKIGYQRKNDENEEPILPDSAKNGSPIGRQEKER